MLAVIAVSSAAWGAVERPVAPVKNCAQGECHAKERNYKFQHGPAALGACDVCHMPADEKKHTFTLKQKDKALCDFCHVEKMAAAKVVGDWLGVRLDPEVAVNLNLQINQVVVQAQEEARAALQAAACPQFMDERYRALLRGLEQRAGGGE